MRKTWTIFVVMALAVLGLADGLPTRTVTYDFIGFIVELTIDSMPDIHRMKIKTRDHEPAAVGGTFRFFTDGLSEK